MEGYQMIIRREQQLSPVTDEVTSIIAVIRPILQGLLYSLKEEVVMQSGGYENIPLFMLPRAYRRGDGDCGICFEYAVHDAVRRHDPDVMNRIESAFKICHMPGSNTDSILFGAEKSGALQIIDTAMDVLTDDSRLLTGERQQPLKLKRYVNMLSAAFRRQSDRNRLPQSISGLWKADLFVGNTDSDRWIGATVKINASALEGARGLRLGLVPVQQGKKDNIYRDENKNLIVCPLPYDKSFMETFYTAWVIIQQFIAADAYIPKEVALPTPSHRYVAQLLEERRQFPVLDVLDALAPLSQPELLATQQSDAVLGDTEKNKLDLTGIVAPLSKTV